MKSLITLTLTILILYSCNQAPDRTFPPVKKLSEYKSTQFLPTLEHKISKDKNAVYCVTLLYAWDEIKKEINLPLQINKDLEDLTLLNNSKSFVNVLKSEEYTTDITVNGTQITAKAEFKKSLPFEEKLESFSGELTFGKTRVASFGTFGYSDAAGKVMDILYYKNNNNFVLQLSPTDELHKIILFKSEKNFGTMAELFAEVEAKMEMGKVEMKKDKLRWKYYLVDEDEVIIPKFKFNIETNYEKLEGNIFKAGTQEYNIETAWQRTAFVLDEAGAEIESEGYSEATTEEPEEEEKPKPKKMRFDKPFFLMLKRTDSKNPYFGMWVANTELMVKE